MKVIKSLSKLANEFFSRYPAVLSGYVIYAYLFVSIMHFYIKAKTIPLGFYDIFTIFSALPFMWFLSVALVKVIEVKTKLFESEHQRILAEKELEIQQTQLQTMQETVRGLQHYINNPLAIIMLSIEAAQKFANENQELNKNFTMAKQSFDKIQVALSGLSSAQIYKTESIDKFYGKMISLKTTIQ
jgi:hypothetical protein